MSENFSIFHDLTTQIHNSRPVDIVKSNHQITVFNSIYHSSLLSCSPLDSSISSESCLRALLRFSLEQSGSSDKSSECRTDGNDGSKLESYISPQSASVNQVEQSVV